MSFRKKTVVLSGPNASAVPGRAPVVPLGTTRGGPGQTRAIRNEILNHAGVKPSVQTSHPTVSTGSNDLDSLLGHWGLPLGNMLLIEESGTTEFNSILMRSFAAQGVVHNRLGTSGKTQIVVIGADENWGRELPGIYKDKKELKREKIEKEESKVSVGNLANSSSSSSKDMKIAWRYARQAGTSVAAASRTIVDTSKPDYNTKFDFTSRLVPAPTPASGEIEYISPAYATNVFAGILERLELTVNKAQQSNTVVRLLVPSLLHPALYPLDATSQVLPFLHGLKSLCRRYASNVAVLVSFSLELFPRTTPLTRWIELTADGVLHLEPFPDSLLPEKDSSSEKINQGLLHIYKLPVTSERGLMVKRLSEHAFRAGRKQFEIKEFGIPVEEPDSSQPATTNPMDY
ncbi:elongator complex protein 4 [Trichomonascus vanleenenianus]|uniref:Elongator subunit ELP4 n=1 Tax=Trichomonascus vanleenenianus TaxID=2268995 RepID=UPI003ECB528C